MKKLNENRKNNNNNNNNNNKNNTNKKYDCIKVCNLILINAFRIVLIILLINAILKGDKEAVLLIALSSITSFYKEIMYLITKIRISDIMQTIFTLFIILTVLFGTLMGVYNKFFWWDTMLHTISGILLSCLALTVLVVMKNKNSDFKYSITLIIIFTFCFAMTGGIIWEILEFCADNLLGMNAQRSKGVDYGVEDTMIDIIANTIGSLIVIAILLGYFRKKNQNEVYNFLEKLFLTPEKSDKADHTNCKKLTKKEIKKERTKA